MIEMTRLYDEAGRNDLEDVINVFTPNVSSFVLFIPNYFSSHVQDGSAQAQSNLRFLNTLKEQCVTLSQAKPADIPDMLAPLLNKIRMIWVNSDHYKSRERLTGLFRKE